MSKLTPQLFIDLMFYAVSRDYKSLRNISNEAQIEHSLQVSKQGFDNRFSQASVDFSKCLLEEALRNQFRDIEPIAEHQLFKRVLIKDSTRFDIDKSLKQYYPSYGGKTSVAGVSLQLEYDLRTGKIHDLDIQSALDRDSVDALKKKELVQKGDLIIRDLGYFHSDVFEHIHSQEAYFLTRLHQTTKVYLTPDCKDAISFSQIYKQMHQIKSSHLDIEVFVGSKRRLPMRLIIVLLPDEIYQKRVRARNNHNKTSGYNTSDEYKQRAHFNLFLCNLPLIEISTDMVCRLYHARWQVELIFKTWKSLIKINDLRKIKITRLRTILNMKLLWVIVHWEIIQPLRTYLIKSTKMILSVFKCVDTLQEYAQLVRQILKLDKKMQIELLQIFYKLLSQNHWLEKRKNKEYYGELMMLFI